MASDSTHPPPSSSGGNLKYGIVGVVLLLGAVGLYFGMKGCDEEPTSPVAAVARDAGTPVDRTAIADDELFIPEPEPDAGPEIDAGRRIRYVTRYVGGGGGGGNWSCSGDLPRATVQSTINENRLQFRNCYERRLKVNDQLAGRVMLSMRVSRSGQVDAVQVGGTLRDGEVLSCIRRIASRMRFSTPSGGGCAVVQAPFDFTPQR